MTRLLGRRRLETRTAKDSDTFMRGKRQRYTRKPVAAIRLSTFSMRLDRFPCMSFVRALAKLGTTRSAVPVPSPHFVNRSVQTGGTHVPRV